MWRSLVMAALVSLLAGLAAARDLPRGSVEVSGRSNFDFNSAEVDVEDQEKSDTVTTTFQLSALYYVMDNLGVGLGGNYESIDTDDGETSAKDTVISIGPAISYNYSMTDVFSVAPMVSGGWMSIESELDESDSEATGWYWQAGLYGKVFLNQLLDLTGNIDASIDGGLSYINGQLEGDDSSVAIDFSGWSIGLGLSIYFRN